MNHDEAERIRVIFDEFMSKTGRRHTLQRKLILDTFLSLDDHVSLQEILAAVGEKKRGIGFATVYRTMKLLVEADIAVERHFGQGEARYEPNHHDEHHDHLICLDCDHIFEFEDDLIESQQSLIAAQHKLRVQSHRHVIYGHCEREPCPHRQTVP